MGCRVTERKYFKYADFYIRTGKSRQARWKIIIIIIIILRPISARLVTMLCRQKIKTTAATLYIAAIPISKSSPGYFYFFCSPPNLIPHNLYITLNNTFGLILVNYGPKWNQVILSSHVRTVGWGKSCSSLRGCFFVIDPTFSKILIHFFLSLFISIRSTRDLLKLPRIKTPEPGFLNI